MIRPTAGRAFVATLLALVPLVPFELQAQDRGVFQASRHLAGEADLRVDVEFAAGRFDLAPAGAGLLYRVHASYPEDAAPPFHRYDDGVLTLRGGDVHKRFTRESEDVLELRLSRDVRTDLRLQLGVVQGDLDLGGIRLRRLELVTGASDAEIRVSETNPEQLERADVKVGAAALRARELGRLNAREIRVEVGVGDVHLDLGGLQREETRVRVSLGMGSLRIDVPQGVAVQLERRTFLTSLDAPGLTRAGNAYETAGWPEGDRRIRIEVNAAVGSVEVRFVDPGQQP